MFTFDNCGSEECGWEQQDESEEREFELDQALRECVTCGISEEALKVLVRETGARNWF